MNKKGNIISRAKKMPANVIVYRDIGKDGLIMLIVDLAENYSEETLRTSKVIPIHCVKVCTETIEEQIAKKKKKGYKNNFCSRNGKEGVITNYV